MSTPSFEIGGVSYISDEIRKGRSYRFCVEWNPPDIDGESKFTTRIVHASADGTLELLPFSIKRFFNSLPTCITVTSQQRRFIWKTLAHHHVSLAADRMIPEHIDGALGLHLIISHHAPGAGQAESIANTVASTNNQLNLNAHDFPGLSTTEGHANIISEFATRSKRPSSTPLAESLATTAWQAPASDTPVLLDVNTNALSKSATINPDNDAKAAVQTAEAEEALSTPKSSKLVDTGNSIMDKYNRIQPSKGNLLATFPDAITAVQGLLKLGGLIAEVHPIANVIVGVLKGAYTIIQANAQINAHMHMLLNCMKDLCVLTKQYTASKEQDSAVRDIVQDISFTVMSGATLINAYAEHQKQKSILQLPTFFTSFEKDADKITEILTSLATKLQGSSVASILNDEEVDGLQQWGVQNL